MNAILITNHNRQIWVDAWIKIIRSFKEQYLICCVDNGGHTFPQADLSFVIPNAKNRLMGDLELMNKGFLHLIQKDDIEYIIKTSADTWLFKEEKLSELLRLLKKSGKHFLSSYWEHPTDVATDFFIISKIFASEFLPTSISLEKILKKSNPEVQFGKRIIKRKNIFLHWTEREPVHPSRGKRRWIWRELGLVTSHKFEENISTVIQERPELKSILEI